jgi:hypothetical protein
VRKRHWTQLDRGRVVAAAKAWVTERPAPIVATIAMLIPVMGYSVLGPRFPEWATP